VISLRSFAFAPTGQLRTLLEPDEAHRPLLTAFLDAISNTRLAWINDVAIGRYEHATEALTTEASNEGSLAQKKVRNSRLHHSRFTVADQKLARKQILFRLSLVSAIALLSIPSVYASVVSTSVFPNSACAGSSNLKGLVGVGRVTLANGQVETHCGCPSVSRSLSLPFLFFSRVASEECWLNQNN